MSKRYTLPELKEIHAQFEELILDQDTFYLIIDKQVTSRRGVVNALSAAGIDRDMLLEAGDGLDAMAMAGRHKGRFIIISEAKLPDMPVDKVITKIRSKDGHAEDKVVVYTGESKREILAPVLKIGVQACLKKPMDAKELVEELRKLDLMIA
jgi:DNA-binding NarL/FixJ family response regulator